MLTSSPAATEKDRAVDAMKDGVIPGGTRTTATSFGVSIAATASGNALPFAAEMPKSTRAPATT